MAKPSNEHLNPISFRVPTFDLTSHDGLDAAHRYVVSGIVDLNQAIVQLKGQIDTNHESVTNTILSSGGGGISPAPPTIGTLGVVNDQLGAASYTTLQSDNGKKLIVGDSAPVTINLSNAVTVPWFVIIDNDSSAVANLTPVGGSVFGQSFISGGCFAIVAFDGANFWSGTAPIASPTRFGLVEPDNVSVVIDSGSGQLRTTGSNGTIVIPSNDLGADGFITVQEGLIINFLNAT